MTLPHTLQNGPGNALDADELMANFEALVDPDGSVPMTGDLDMGGNAITGVSAINDSFLRGRNRIVNGAMEFNQRNEETAYTVSTAAVNRTIDCWDAYGAAADGVFTVQRLTTTPPAGFSHYQQFKTTTADASIGSAQFYFAKHSFEGTRVRDLLFGTASAKTVTVSFWARASATGTYGIGLVNGSADRAYPTSFVIAAADTWEKKEMTIPGDTTGTWVTTTATAMRLYFDIGCGTDYKGTANAWVAVFKCGITGGTNLIATLNATLDITGVQLEIGSVATEFEQLPPAAGLAEVERYIGKTFATGTAAAQNSTVVLGSLTYKAYVAGTAGANGALWQYPEMRAAPTITLYDTNAAATTWRNITDAGASGASGTLHIGTKSAFITNAQVATDGVGETLCIHALRTAEL